jgi:hypothetical protein
MRVYFGAIVALFFAVLFGLGYLVESLWDAQPSATLAWTCLIGFVSCCSGMTGLLGVATLRTVVELFGFDDPVDAFLDMRPSALLAWACFGSFLVCCGVASGLLGMTVLRTIVGLFGG